MASTKIDLSNNDWAEIYYALADKALRLKQGAYGPEDRRGDNKKWLAHLEEIMGAISTKVDV